MYLGTKIKDFDGISKYFAVFLTLLGLIGKK
jgi:hypothetical protein